MITNKDMDQSQIFSLTDDKHVQHVVSKLIFLSKIQKGEKINIKDLFVRDNDSVLQRLFRSLRNYSTYMSGSDIVESKEATLEFIDLTVNAAITLILSYSKSTNEFHKRIIAIITEHLEQAKKGINNSINTYSNDRRFISQAIAVIKTLEARLESLQRKIELTGLTNTPLMLQDTEPQTEDSTF